VLGQLDFTHNGANILTAAGLAAPGAVAIDRSVVPNRIYIADAGNHRVLGWHSVDALTNGAPAGVVLGQPDFLTSLFQCNNAAVTGQTLCIPAALAVDPAGNLYIADSGNNRVLEYDSPFTTDTVPDMVFGQGGSFTSSACNLGGSITDATLCQPGGVTVDGAGHVYVSDTGNSRVLEYDAPSAANTHADAVFGQGGKFDSGLCNNGGVSAASLCHPSYLASDQAGNLYVNDRGNFRVLEYDTPLATDTVADLVFGQGNSFTSNTNHCTAAPGAATFCTAEALAVDSRGNLYIPDSSFARVLEFNNPVGSGQTTADGVFGQPDLTSAGCNNGGLSAASLCGPTGAAVDMSNNLYVADSVNNRVLKFNDPLASNPPETTADVVLGQLGFNRDGVNLINQRGLYAPSALAIDTSAVPNRLYVADSRNNRVLGWNSVPGFVNGASADLVIGQPDFLSGDCNQTAASSAGIANPTASTLCDPQGVAVDAQGNLYVADASNYRVLEYDQPFSSGKVFNLAAHLVFGQHGSFTSRIPNRGGVSADSLSGPSGVATDPAGNLYVADSGNNRVLEYSAPVTLNNTSADAVFGQANDFSTAICNFDQTCRPTGCTPGPAGLCRPQAVAVNAAGTVFIADGANARILGYLNPLATDKVADLILANIAASGLGFDAPGNLYAAAGAVVVFNAPLFSAEPSMLLIAQQMLSTQPEAAGVCDGTGAALDSSNNLYVADSCNNRVLEFNRPWPTATPTATATPAPTPTPSAAPTAMPPVITSLSPPVILVGTNFTISGANFTAGSKVNFFVATAEGPINAGPLIPVTRSLPTRLTVALPVSVPLGQGFCAVQVVNTDQNFATSTPAPALLQGSAAAGLPSLTSINGVPLAATSADPGYAANNVETVVKQGTEVQLGGNGFDVANGVAIDLFCDCKGGKVGAFFLNPGNPGLSPTLLEFPLPSSGNFAPATGPGSFVISNAGTMKTYSHKSNAVSVPIGAKVSVTMVTQAGSTITVDGNGFSTQSVINLFNMQGGAVVNLGGVAGTAKIPLTLVDATRLTFTEPAGAVPGPAYVQVLNPPFLPYTSSGSAFTLQ